MDDLLSTLLKHAFLAGWEASQDNATLELDGRSAWPHYEPPVYEFRAALMALQDFQNQHANSEEQSDG